MFDEERPAKPKTHVVGEDLATLSVDELEARVAQLAAEIERLRSAIARKRASHTAAQSFFKS